MPERVKEFTKFVVGKDLDAFKPTSDAHEKLYILGRLALVKLEEFLRNGVEQNLRYALDVDYAELQKKLDSLMSPLQLSIMRFEGTSIYKPRDTWVRGETIGHLTVERTYYLHPLGRDYDTTVRTASKYYSEISGSQLKGKSESHIRKQLELAIGFYL